MKNKYALRKVLNATLLGVCIVPLAGGIAAKAAPPTNHKDHTPSKSQARDAKHDSNQSHSRDTSHNTKQAHPTNQSHTAPRPQNTQSHKPSQPHTTNKSNSSHQSPSRSHVTPQTHSVAPSQHQNWQRTNNNHYDDNWHRSHGYIKNGSHWNWRGHDDDYWISHGYGWNGSSWLILNSFQNSYGPYRTFEGVVTNVNYGGNEFDIRINGNTYNVYASVRLPGRLNRGDTVRVYGRRYGNNDIRNANVSILRDR